MIYYNPIGSNDVMTRVVDSVMRQTAIEKGDQFFVPENAKWLVNASNGNPNSRARVILAQLLPDNLVVTREVYINQLSRLNRQTKTLVFPDDKVNSVVNVAGSRGFNKVFANHIITVDDVEEGAFDYAYDENGSRSYEADGKTAKYANAKAYKFSVVKADPKKLNIAELNAVCEKHLQENYVKKETEDEE